LTVFIFCWYNEPQEGSFHMEIQLQELIDKIKKDGLDSAAEEAAELKAAAEKEAQGIVDQAKKEAAAIIAKGKEDAERDEKAGIAAVGQAGRNAVLAFKAEIQGLLDRIVANETAKAMDDGVLKAALPDLLKDTLSDALRPASAASPFVHGTEKLKGIADRKACAGKSLHHLGEFQHRFFVSALSHKAAPLFSGIRISRSISPIVVRPWAAFAKPSCKSVLTPCCRSLAFISETGSRFMISSSSAGSFSNISLTTVRPA
jgi:hypothetical protein